jgi:hypothetical protein
MAKNIKECPGGGGGCRTLCEAIEDEHPYYIDTMSCP